MKKFALKKSIIIFLPLLFLSCSGLAVNYSGSQSWIIRENKHRKTKPTLAILSVQVDMTGNRDSIEREAAALAPLYFWNRGCKVLPAYEKPEYAASIYVREREISFGWQIKKSLSVEVHIWNFNDAPFLGSPVYERKLPAVAGRVISTGEKSFSSSDITGRLLKKTIDIASRKLSAHKRRNKNA